MNLGGHQGQPLETRRADMPAYVGGGGEVRSLGEAARLDGLASGVEAQV